MKVSLDLYFLDRDDRRRWTDALADLDRVDGDRPFSPHELEVWAQLVESLTAVLPEAQAAAGDESRVLDDEATGISVLFATDEVSVSIPFDDLTAADTAVVEVLTEVVTVVEAQTGLVAYNPLADQPFLPGRRSGGSESSDRVRHLFGDPGLDADGPR